MVRQSPFPLWSHLRCLELFVVSPDGRRDTDADFGKKTYAGVREDGTVWQKIVKWFGYKLHLIVDADYELPVAFEVTKASCSEIPQGRKLLKKLKERHEELIKEDCNALIADALLKSYKNCHSERSAAE